MSREVDDVDQLYQLPLDEFTAARNELAKRTSNATRASEIRALQKPSVPAWAVNQLFWRRRKSFDKLIEAARRLRVEHGRQLSGKAAEVEAAEGRHRESMRAAADDIRDILKAAGEQDSHATMMAVTETLQALPGRDDHGRLVKPLKPLGFEALAGLVGGSGATIARLADVKATPAAAPARPPASKTVRAGHDKAAAREDAARRKRESQARAKEIAAAERMLQRAEAEVRTTKAEFSRAEMTLARLQRERKELQERIDSVTSRRDQAAVDLDERRRVADRAKSERDRLAAHLDSLKK